MRSVGKALLFALSSAGTLGARTSPNFPRVNVLQSISSMLQKRNMNTKVIDEIVALASQAPGVSESLNSILNNVTDEIDELMAHVKTACQSVQNELDTNMNELEGSTNYSVRLFETAKLADSTWFSCIRQQKALLEAVEDEQSALTTAKSGVGEPCQQQEDLSPFTANITPSTFTFSCDNSVENNCNDQFENFNSNVEGMVKGVKDDMASQNELYTAAKTACDAANAAVVAKQSDLDDASQAFSHQQITCNENHETRSLALCEFGEALKEKCKDVTEFHALLGNVDAASGAQSISAMQEEWNAMCVMKCLLEGVVETGTATNETMLDLCESETKCDFDSMVCQLNRLEDQLEEETSAERFTCDETAITFSGSTWEISESAGSLGYKVVEWSPAVNFSSDYAFAFCAPEADIA